MNNLQLNQNILGIPDPQNYACWLNHYAAERSIFWFRINHLRNPDNYREAVYVTFTNVTYFEGLLSWSGANFQIAPEEEKRALIQRISRKPGNEIESLPLRYQPTVEEVDRFYRTHNLYKVKTINGLEVKMIALSFEKLSWIDLPNSFFPNRKHPDKS